MIRAVGAVARRMPSAARRSGCWIAWCQAALLAASALVIVAERIARKWAKDSGLDGSYGNGTGGVVDLVVVCACLCAVYFRWVMSRTPRACVSPRAGS